MSPLLSICIPTYNRADCLWKTLNSITTQKAFLFTNDVEIVISDNCSTDATEFVCNEFINKYPDKIVYKKTERNIGGDENFIYVLKQANGRFVKLHNDSCYILENSLEKMLEDIKFVDKNNCSGCFFADGTAKKQCINNSFDEFIANVSYFSTWIASYCFRRDFLEKCENINRYSHLNFAQVDIAGRLFEAGNKIYVSNAYYFKTIYVDNKGGYNIAKVFGYNYFYILDIYRKKKLLSNRTFNKEKRKIIRKFLITQYFDFYKQNSFVKDGYFKYMKYFWFDWYFYFTYLRIFKYYIKSILPKGRKIRKNNKKIETKWHSKNFDNTTILNSYNELIYPAVGKESYGFINVLCHTIRPVILIIGNYVSIAPDVKFILGSDHNYKILSTYPFKVKVCGEKYEALSKGSIIVEDDVWIGANAIILSGIRIGQGAVVAAGSVVTKDVEPYSIVAGNPAKIMKYRFPREIIEKMKNFNVGMLTENSIKTNINDMYKELTCENVDSLLSELKGNI